MTPLLAPALDSATLARALTGHPDALARLYVRYHPLVLRLARGVLARSRSVEAAAELAAEVWLRLLARGLLRKFDPGRGSFDRFLRMVVWQQATWIALGWARRQRIEVLGASEELLGPAPSEPSALEIMHRRLVLRRVVDHARLSAMDRTVLEESLLWRTPAPELARRLGCSEAALYSQRTRVRARLVRAGRRC